MNSSDDATDRERKKELFGTMRESGVRFYPNAPRAPRNTKNLRSAGSRARYLEWYNAFGDQSQQRAFCNTYAAEHEPDRDLKTNQTAPLEEIMYSLADFTMYELNIALERRFGSGALLWSHHRQYCTVTRINQRELEESQGVENHV